MKYNEFTKQTLAQSGRQAANEFVNVALASVQFAHHAHLTERSYARHMALGEYYGAMPELIDAVAETYLASDYTELTFAIPQLPTVVEQAIELVYDKADAMHSLVDKGTQNVLEDVMSMCKGTLYKLKRLS